MISEQLGHVAEYDVVVEYVQFVEYLGRTCSVPDE
jgi:hypothetical protein